MEQKKFSIKYQDQILEVEEHQDVNTEFFYKVTFPDQKQIDIYITPITDGLSPNWAEGKGENTNRAKEIGELIEAYNL